MQNNNAKCPYFYIDNNGDKHHCIHTNYRSKSTCIFHDPDVGSKGRHFYDALEILFSDPNSRIIDLKGFVFPKIVYTKKIFDNDVDLRGAIFSSSARFDGCEFKSKVQMVGTVFKDMAFFQGCDFHGKVQLTGVKFEGKTIFVGAAFQQKAVFHGVKYSELATFNGANFHEDCIFQLNTFYGDADFQNTKFQKNVDFNKTIFRKRGHFGEAHFEGEISFNEVNSGILKELKGGSISFDGAVLETYNFWGMKRLNSYSFRNTFLINCNFSGIELKNCDFTGAVFKSPHTSGWMPDDETLHNTKYIYSDYEASESIDESGAVSKKYSAKEETRIPTAGSFLDENNTNFSLLDYAKEPHKWEYLLDFPEEIQTGIINYINFFKDYSRITEGISIDLATATYGDKVKVSLLLEDTAETEKVGVLFKKYVSHILKPFDRFDVVFGNSKATPTQQELLLINLSNELSANQSRMAHALDSLPKLQKTVESFGNLLEVKNSDHSKILEILSRAVGSPAIGNINLSPSFSNNNEVRVSSNIDISLGELLDLLSDARRDATKESAMLTAITKELSSVRETNLSEVEKKLRVGGILKELISFMGKAADYGIKNGDKILSLVDRIGKLM